MKKEKNKHRYNAENERVKYNYRKHLTRAKQRDEKTVTAALMHIREYELYTDFKGFGSYHRDMADKYIQSLLNRELSMSYICDNIRYLKEFLQWLERQHGYKSKINYNDIDYLNISKNQQRQSKATQYKKAYSYEQIITAIRLMPCKTDKEKRDKAIISLQAICTLRVSELRSVKMQNLIKENERYFLHITPKNMDVKFAKTRIVCFVPLPDDIIANVIDWVDYLKALGFKDNDPLFPAVDNRFTQTSLLQQTMRKDSIKSDGTIRKVFKKSFEAAGYEYIRPHSFRTTIARFAQHQTPAFFNAVRQNLGHSSIDTTLSSYGQLSYVDQGRALIECGGKFE